MKKNTTKTVDEISSIVIVGNCIPPIWYKTINYRNKRGIYPHLLAINLLADLCYWYKPTIERNESTGQIISVRKKFKEDKLQRSYDQIVQFFGCSKEQAKDAVSLLEFRGLITKEFRTIQTSAGPTPNVMYLEPIPSAIKEYSNPEIDMGEFTDIDGVGKFTDTYKLVNQYVKVDSQERLREITMTNTKTTHKNPQDTSHKEEHADKSAPPAPDEPEKKEPPKSKKKSQRKKVAPKKEKLPAKQPSIQMMARNRFDEWLKVFDPNAAPIYWDGKEIGQLKNMINRLKDAAMKKGYECDSDEDFINNIFDVFCKKFIESGAWYADCFVPSSIVSKWNTIIQTLHKNGQTSKKTNQGVTSDFKQRQYDILNRAKQQAAYTG